ncbi:MAG: DUF1573 domain-containing protein [Bacteroidales bacterium]|nr:DUF1573 domain-containing protein [Bacteroidales bacterium]
MKKVFSLIGVLCILSINMAFAQADKTTSKVKKGRVPEITFDKMEHDYGTIYEGDNGTCEFKFKNTGKEPLILSNVYSSCGCTVPTWPKEAIMPGKTAVIGVKYNTSRIGVINKKITVISNAEASPRVELQIKGNVKPKAEAEYPEKAQSPMQAKPTK